MAQPIRITRIAGMALLAAVALGGALTAFDQARATSQPTLVRGNAPGEWRYWGADAWSTRYSPLDQINASNFESLEQAWQWNAGSFRADGDYRATPVDAHGGGLTGGGPAPRGPAAHP